MTIPGKRRGFALMLVMLEMTLIGALWGIAHRQLASTMRFVAIQQGQFNRNLQPEANLPQAVDVHKPLARALSLLETGDPPDGGSGVYTCNLTVLTNSGPAYFTITYLKSPGDSPTSETWTVSSAQQYPDANQVSTWNTMPSSFQ